MATLDGFDALPGADLVAKGLRDLGDGAETPESLLVSMAATRLRAVGIDVPPGSGAASGHRLYTLLSSEDGAAAHSRYNALVGRLASFARAAEHARTG